MTQILRRPPRVARPVGYAAPLSAPNNPQARQHRAIDESNRDSEEDCLTRDKAPKKECKNSTSPRWRERGEREGALLSESGRVVTYLLQLVQRRLVHAKLLEVVV